MALFALSYDLIKRKDYPKLWSALKEMGAHKALRSFYLVNLQEDNPQDLVNYLRQFIDEDDGLVVVRFVGKPSFTKAATGTNSWIEANT